ncbi:MAG: 1,2-phenylacetyl-CoA epoxidase subunit PaaC [Pseudomonadota bacterium]
MSDNVNLFTYLLRLADDHLILSQRLGEWCSAAPTLEEDLALANIALDLIGQARSLYSYAGEVEGKGRDEDQLAFLRYEQDYLNALITEQPNGDFAHTIVRQFFISAFMVPFWRKMEQSADETLAAIAAKASKEVAYHLRHTSEWVIRLGDGTQESRSRMIEALDDLVIYTGELFENDSIAEAAIEAGYGVDVSEIKDEWDHTVASVLREATLELPSVRHMQTGGRSGRHTEHLGHILSELQYMQRAYPGMSW